MTREQYDEATRLYGELAAAERALRKVVELIDATDRGGFCDKDVAVNLCWIDSTNLKHADHIVIQIDDFSSFLGAQYRRAQKRVDEINNSILRL